MSIAKKNHLRGAGGEQPSRACRKCNFLGIGILQPTQKKKDIGRSDRLHNKGANTGGRKKNV